VADFYVFSEVEIKGSDLVVGPPRGGPCVIIWNMHERFGHGIERGQQTCEHKVCDLIMCLRDEGWGAKSRRHSCVMEIGETCFDASRGCENSGWLYEKVNWKKV
jgi:hypothetical protein